MVVSELLLGLGNGTVTDLGSSRNLCVQLQVYGQRGDCDKKSVGDNADKPSFSIEFWDKKHLGNPLYEKASDLHDMEIQHLPNFCLVRRY
jgi:hypothetical protein